MNCPVGVGVIEDELSGDCWLVMVMEDELSGDCWLVMVMEDQEK